MKNKNEFTIPCLDTCAVCSVSEMRDKNGIRVKALTKFGFVETELLFFEDEIQIDRSNEYIAYLYDMGNEYIDYFISEVEFFMEADLWRRTEKKYIENKKKEIALRKKRGLI